MKKAIPPFQLVLIDENGRQMLSMESESVFSKADFEAVNKAIKGRTLDENETGCWFYS